MHAPVTASVVCGDSLCLECMRRPALGSASAASCGRPYLRSGGTLCGRTRFIFLARRIVFTGFPSGPDCLVTSVPPSILPAYSATWGAAGARR